jgi:hypothetical protein
MATNIIAAATVIVTSQFKTLKAVGGFQIGGVSL